MRRKLVLLLVLIAAGATIALLLSRTRPGERAERRDLPETLERPAAERTPAPGPAPPTAVRPAPSTAVRPAPEPAAPPPAPRPPGQAAQAALQVHVREQDGPLLAGAEVRITLSVEGVGRSGPTAVTDASGTVEFRDLVAEQVIAVSAAHAGFTRSCQVRLRPGSAEQITIEIPQRGLVARGVVRHFERGPMAGATVRLSRSRGNGFDYVSARTDTRGRFELARLAPGEWRLELYGPGLAYHEQKRGKWRLEAPGPCEREIVLGQLSLTGVVRDAATGAPLAGAEVQPQSPHWATTRTDREGRFSLRSLPPGSYSVLVRKRGYANRWFRSVAVRAHEPARVVFELDPAATLHVKLVDEQGRPLPGEHIVSFDREDEQGWSGNRVADAEGVIRLQSVAPGPCKVSAYGWAGRAKPVPVEITGGRNEVRLVMQAPARDANRGRLTGVVREARTQRPLAGVRIRLRSGDVRDAYTDAHGRFVLPRVYKGAWPVRAARDGYLERDLGTVTITPGATAKIETELEPARTLHVRVLDTNGLPYAGRIYLLCRPEERAERWSWRLETDPDGRLTCHRVPPGKSLIRVWVPDRGQAESPLDLTTPTATLELQLQ